MLDLKYLYLYCLWNGQKLYFFHSSLAGSVGLAGSWSRDSYRQDLGCVPFHSTLKQSSLLPAHTACQPRALPQNEISPFGTPCNVTNAHITSSVSPHFLLQLLLTKANYFSLINVAQGRGSSLHFSLLNMATIALIFPDVIHNSVHCLIFCKEINNFISCIVRIMLISLFTPGRHNDG